MPTKYKWPRFDLEPSLAVAEVLMREAGGQADSPQLAALLEYQNAASGTYANRLAAAKMFGFVEGQSPRIRSTKLAERILQPVYPEDAVEARLEAFLKVPLFGAFFDAFEGRTLPDSKAGVENALKSQFGVEDNHAATARVKLLNSAEQAGLFRVAGPRKMVRPLAKEPVTGPTEPAPKEQEPLPADSGPLHVPKVIGGLLESVPWESQLADEQVEEFADFLKGAMLWHFRFQRQASRGEP